jgi:hypothetical protein
VTAASWEEGMQANPNGDRVCDRGCRERGSEGAADPSAALNKLTEYAYRAAILAVMVLLLWTVA